MALPASYVVKSFLCPPLHKTTIMTILGVIHLANLQVLMIWLSTSSLILVNAQVLVNSTSRMFGFFFPLDLPWPHDCKHGISNNSYILIVPNMTSIRNIVVLLR
jgi:hypothetical protein